MAMKRPPIGGGRRPVPPMPGPVKERPATTPRPVSQPGGPRGGVTPPVVKRPPTPAPIAAGGGKRGPVENPRKMPLPIDGFPARPRRMRGGGMAKKDKK